MLSKLLSALVFLVGGIVWAVGAWSVYDGNSLLGAILVLVGGLLVVLNVAWWRRDPDAGFEGVLTGIVEFMSRAR
jgi:hypothetical protein